MLGGSPLVFLTLSSRHHPPTMMSPEREPKSNGHIAYLGVNKSAGFEKVAVTSSIGERI